MAGTSSFSKIAVLGPGILGGSLALAVKRFLPACEVALWGRREEPLQYARQHGAADLCATDMSQVVQDADLIVMASPVGAMMSLAESFCGFLKDGALVTDVGSVKGFVHRHVGAFLEGKGIDFIGSHPMAGSERQGIEYASASLFKGATVAITQGNCQKGGKLEALKQFWESVGANCLTMTPDEHDRLVARISHLPHAMAALCVSAACVGGEASELSAMASTGFRDTTRVAGGSPSMWAEILLENSDAVLDALSDAQESLTALRDMLASKNSRELEAWLSRARQQRQELLDLSREDGENA